MCGSSRVIFWSVELRWAQRVAGLPVTDRKEMPQGPLDALFNFQLEAMRIARTLLGDSSWNWEETMELEFSRVPADLRVVSRRKAMAHMLFHSQRHWAQMATLTRSAGCPSGFRGDLLFSSMVR